MLSRQFALGHRWTACTVRHRLLCVLALLPPSARASSTGYVFERLKTWHTDDGSKIPVPSQNARGMTSQVEPVHVGGLSGKQHSDGDGVHRSSSCHGCCRSRASPPSTVSAVTPPPLARVRAIIDCGHAAKHPQRRSLLLPVACCTSAVRPAALRRGFSKT